MKRQTACSRDCPDACALVAEEDQGQVVALKGSRQDPVTRGFLCPRTSRFLQRQGAPERLLTPWRRCHPLSQEFEPISWPEALDLAAAKLREARDRFGAEAIFHYQSGGSLGYLKALTQVVFQQLGSCTTKRGDICSGAGKWAQEQDFGISESSELEDLRQAELILIWGKNVHTSSVHLWPLLVDAKRRGAVLVNVDPTPTRSAGLADLSLCPRPGTDAQLALAMVTYLEQHGGIDPDASRYCRHLPEFLAMARSVSIEERLARAQIPWDQGRELCRLYLERKPSWLLLGWGGARRSNGAATVRVLDAMAAVAGNVGRAGACVSFAFGRRRGLCQPAFPPAPYPPGRSLSETRLGMELEQADPPIRVAWITAGNPAAMLPDAARIVDQLRRIDFTVVVDTHWTDTCLAADLVLPTLTLLEDEDLVGSYGNSYLRSSEGVIAPLGEARHELWIHQQLAERLGFGDLLAGTPREWKERLLHPEADRAVLDGETVRQPGAPKVVFEGRVFPTPDGRVQLVTQEPPLPPPPTPDFPFRLMAISHPDSQSSQWSVTPPELPWAQLSEEAAGPWPDGAVVRLESALGGFPVRLQRVAGLHPEVILLPKGGSRFGTGWSPNTVISARETDFGEGACFYEEPVRLSQL